ncbi:hypothetical protein EVAR_101340_1 [Eumeta japonica]|uniref:Uncharacterized protein n=1 Tax=Eumeta variegata TaxID=151549 RepID=A0A4C1SV86_EUMVA|nr:hypothetical protein EVAR_101340_1 [Eumeta japonica]
MKSVSGRKLGTYLSPAWFKLELGRIAESELKARLGVKSRKEPEPKVGPGLKWRMGLCSKTSVDTKSKLKCKEQTFAASNHLQHTVHVLWQWEAVRHASTALTARLHTTLHLADTQSRSSNTPIT